MRAIGGSKSLLIIGIAAALLYSQFGATGLLVMGIVLLLVSK